MKKTAGIIMLLTIIVKISGFLRDVVLSFFYGASNISDAYLIALTIPSVIFAFISVSVTTGFIPVYSKIELEQNNQISLKFTNKLKSLLMLISLVIILFGFIYAEFVIKIFASGFSEETLKLAVMFSRITIFSVLSSVLMAIYRGYLQAKNKFVATSLIALPNNIIVLCSIYLSFVFENLYILAVGTLLGSLSQFLFLLPFTVKEGYRPSFNFRFKDKNIKTFSVIVLPVILGVSINEINILIDRTLASNFDKGSISALEYSFSLIQFINGTFSAAIAIAIYPLISKMVLENNMKSFQKTVSSSLSSISLMIIPISVFSMIYSEEVIRLLYGRGAFDEQAIKLTSGVLFYYSIGILSYGYREVLTRAFYSTHDSKTPMLTSVIALLLNIILNLILSFYMGTKGLALATSLAGTLSCILLLYSYNKKIIDINLRTLTLTTLKIIISSVVMGLVSRSLFNNIIDESSLLITMILSVIVGVIIYAFLLSVLKVDEAKQIFNKINKEYMNLLKK